MKALRMKALKAVAVACVMLLAAACGQTVDDALTESVEPVELVVAGFPGHGFNELIVEWEREHPGVRVIFNERTYDGHHQYLEEALGSGDTPDVAVVEVAFAPRFLAMADEFINLSDLGAADIENTYLDWRWQQGIGPEGQVIGVPTDLGGLAVAYRTDLFAEAGLPTERSEVAELWPTWDRFVEVGKDFSANSGVAFMDDAGTLFQVIVEQYRLQYYAEDGEIIAGSSQAVGLGWEYGLRAASAKIDFGVEAFTPQWNEGMANGDYAVLLAPAWMMTYIQAQAPGTAGLWDIASIPSAGGNWGGSQLTIPADAEHPELAWDLVNYLLGPAGQFNTFARHGNFPSIPQLIESDAILDMRMDFFNDAPVGEIYGASALALQPSVVGPDQRAITNIFAETLRSVRSGEIERQDAWKGAIERLDELKAAG